MKKVQRCVTITLLIVAAGIGAGCVQEPAPTVEYYRSHASERQAQLDNCADDPGSLQDSPACVNAIRAAELEQFNSLRDLPPMGLQPEPPKDDAPEVANGDRPR